MKKLLLLITVLFLTGTTVEAQKNYGKRMGYKKHVKMQPITFTERGVQFSILPNGKMKFKKAKLRPYEIHYANNWKKNRQLNVVRNFRGDIVRVGKVKIFYNKRGKITQIGKVDIKYKHGLMKKVGNLHIAYNHYGKAKYYGQVKYRNHWRSLYDERPYLIR